MTLEGGPIAGIVIGSVVGSSLVIVIALKALQCYMRGPLKGSRNPKSMEGKVVAITGCNTGIGKETVNELAKRGAKVLMLCRNLEKAEETAGEIRKNTGAELKVIELDLSSLDSVRACAQVLIQHERQIDILINNAGVMMCDESKTKDGLEMQIGTNHFGHFLLTELLMPLLKNSAAACTGFTPRIVIVSSMGHTGGSMNWDDIHYHKIPGSYGPTKAYFQSKLANVLHAKELARRVKDSGIHVYVLHPGVVATELGRHLYERHPWLAFVGNSIVSYFIKTPFHGAQTTLYCVLEDSIENDTGKYYSDCREKAPHWRALVEEDQKRFWKISEETVGLTVGINS